MRKITPQIPQLALIPSCISFHREEDKEECLRWLSSDSKQFGA